MGGRQRGKEGGRRRWPVAVAVAGGDARRDSPRRQLLVHKREERKKVAARRRKEGFPSPEMPCRRSSSLPKEALPSLDQTRHFSTIEEDRCRQKLAREERARCCEAERRGERKKTGRRREKGEKGSPSAETLLRQSSPTPSQGQPRPRSDHIDLPDLHRR